MGGGGGGGGLVQKRRKTDLAHWASKNSLVPEF